MNTNNTPLIQTNQFNFRDYYLVLYKRRKLILYTVIGVLIPIIFWIKFTTPIFEGVAIIIYEEPTESMFALDVGQPYYNRSAIINLTEQVKSLTLAKDVAKALPAKVINTFKFPDPLPNGFSKERFIAGFLRNNLEVKGVRGGEVLTITVRAYSDEAAKVITNTYVNQLIEWNLRKNREEVINVRNFVEQQVDVYKQNLDVAEKELQEFKEQNQMISLSETSTDALNSMTEAEIAYNTAQAERSALEQRWQYIEQKKKEFAPVVVKNSDDKTQSLKQALFDLEVKYSSLQLQGLTESSPEIVSLKNQTEKIKNQLIQEILANTQRDNMIDQASQLRTLLQESITLEIDIATYKARENSLKAIIENYSLELKKLPQKESDLARLIRTRTVNDQIYATLMEKLQEARITEAGEVGDIHVIDYAERPLHPIKPRKSMTTFMGLIFGLFLGISVAFILDALDNSIKSNEDIEKYLNIPVLASIPSFKNNGVFPIKSKYRHKKENYSSKLLSDFSDEPYFYEAYRALQFNFAFLNTDKKIKTLVISSTGASEGKTLNAINIALLFSRNGIKTLLIDCDLRRPMIHNILGLKQEPGLTNVLINKVSIERSLQPLLNKNLTVLTSGLLPPNPSDILNSQRMQEVLNEAKEQYELIILDTPPILPVTDAIVLGTKGDGVFLVVRSNHTSRDAALRAQKIFKNSGVDIIGVILNDVNYKNVYGNYKDYYYYYSEKKKNS